MKGVCKMDGMYRKVTKVTPSGHQPADVYDDGNIPKEDLPEKDIIPDEVPRKDGPGGEGK